MLMNFKFSNLYSYRDETNLDLSASTRLKDNSEYVTRSAFGEYFLSTAVIFGANSSGKSNLLMAFNTFRDIVLRGGTFTGEYGNFQLDRYRFLKEQNPNTNFEVTFQYKKNEYIYKVDIELDSIVYESLEKRKDLKTKVYECIFKRDNTTITTNLELDHLLDSLFSKLNNRVLLLDALKFLGSEHIDNTRAFFFTTNVLLYGNNLFERRIHEKVPVSIVNNDIEETKKDLRYRALIIFLESMGVSFDDLHFHRFEDGTFKIFSVYHIDKVAYLLPLQSESSGTLKAISMFEDIWNTLQLGGTIFVDELDAKLHPKLTKHILRLFSDKNINFNNAQLIFSTHDMSLLKKEMLRKDQIWIADRDPATLVSCILRLSNFKLSEGSATVRGDASYDKLYLDGRLGGIARFSDFEQLKELLRG